MYVKTESSTGGFRGGGRDVRPPKKLKKKQINTQKKINGEEREQRERERRERFNLFASNYHNNLQVYLNLL